MSAAATSRVGCGQVFVVHHRVNTSAELASVPENEGVEIDLRAGERDVILAHDAFCSGEFLTGYLRGYHHRLLIANVKSDGIEPRVTELLSASGVRAFFLLDVAPARLTTLALSGFRQLAVRVSRYETVAAPLANDTAVAWAWVDYAPDHPITIEEARTFGKRFRLCLVSPELQGFDADCAQRLRDWVSRADVSFDAVCTDLPELWRAP